MTESAVLGKLIVDLKKDPMYAAGTEPTPVYVPEMTFVMVDGEGLPESAEGETEFQRAMRILFGIVYTVKFWDKKHPAPEGYSKFSLAPVEGIWWTKSGRMFDTSKPDDWRWTVMLRVPEFVTPDYFKQVVDELKTQKGDASYGTARLERFEEGHCAQVLHVGPYDQEQDTIDKLHEYISQSGCSVSGKHHELYLSDPHRSKPENLKTIVRYPIDAN